MNYLLDTSTFLWYVSAESELSPQARSIIGDTRNNVYLSFVSIWELSIKCRIGKLELTSESLSDWLDMHLAANSFRHLEIKVSHLLQYADLPLVHRDPFDGLLIAQSQVENIPVITSDAAFDSYEIQRAW
ncbi:MAG: type II toxin-antitoxin system VapC family toxin [Chloroflexi bacterium]|nr:type II toxin-antitoxin system VapC family toxin [Chloroflexota bacterium]